LAEETGNNNPGNPVFCGNCGGELNPAYRFCTACGAAGKTQSPSTDAPPPADAAVSPEAKKALENFENEMAALRMRRARTGKSPFLPSKDPNVTILVIGGFVFLAFLMGIFYFMMRYMAYLTRAAGV
jgi:hypothetical protein